jgi:hypothetical protein
MSGVPGDPVAVVRALLGVQDAQTTMLNLIARDVALVREGPFRSAQARLEQAARAGVRNPRYSKLLEESESRFIDAIAQAASAQERAVVEFHLGYVCCLLNERDEAKHWIVTSEKTAKSVLVELMFLAEDVRIGDKDIPWAIKHTEPLQFLPPVWAATGVLFGRTKLRKVWRAQRAISALRTFVPFVNCSEASSRIVRGLSNRPPTYDLRQENRRWSLIAGEHHWPLG